MKTKDRKAMSGLEIQNGIPMYLIGKLIDDFSIIFCQAHNNSISFIGARNNLAIHLKIINRKRLTNNTNENWNLTYSFDSKQVKRNIAWFTKKANSTKKVNLSIIPDKSKLVVLNDFVQGEMCSFVENPPIPNIPEMSGGRTVNIVDLKEMVNQIKLIKEEVIKLKFLNSIIKMSGSEYDTPFYNVFISGQHSKIDEKELEISTFCLKQMLLISCQLASEVSQSAEMRFYPDGATQISSHGSDVSVRCLLTAVKI